ncbi:hypothetical protein L1857_00035 [Amycolatopsis thermalba]|uniref:Uncharacterized protein n=1 Tax=Amycolatopsis thermalba TaxID=944492 RepID=A0ABY4NLQ4_9PSEU|nr:MULTISPECIES: hypothetical protein [Amycolatopsis]UQS21333.1 hypothetical protein L1857_00035 [Amycolatopsis thermalba]
MFLSLLLCIFLPTMAVSIGLTFIPWRPLWLRAGINGAQFVVSVYAIAALPVRSNIGWEFWAFFLGPGTILALLQALAAAFNARDARRERRTDPYPGDREHGP